MSIPPNQGSEATSKVPAKSLFTLQLNILRHWGYGNLIREVGQSQAKGQSYVTGNMEANLCDRGQTHMTGHQSVPC